MARLVIFPYKSLAKKISNLKLSTNIKVFYNFIEALFSFLQFILKQLIVKFIMKRPVGAAICI